MSLRNRLLLIFVALAFAPLLAVSVINYLGATRAVGEVLRGRAEERAERITRGVEQTLDEQQNRLLFQARTKSLGDFVRAARGAPAGGAAPGAPLPETASAHLIAFFQGGRGYFASVTCFDASGKPLFRLAPRARGGGPEFQTQGLDILKGVVRPDDRVWGAREAVRSPVGKLQDHGSSLLISAPVAAGPAQEGAAGALVLEISLRDLFGGADRNEAPLASGDSRGRHTVVALDNASGLVAYHTEPAPRHQPVATAMPYFMPVARRMLAHESGGDSYRTSDGDRWLVSFRQVGGGTLSLAVAENYAAASGVVRRTGLCGVAAAVAAGLAGLALVWLSMGRAANDLRRIALGAKAVAAGDFNQRVETEGMTGATREVAESFNQMSDRLRAHITTTSETRQFESFMRLSAMLSHDLKNAITGLSMLVTNMEKHIHREEFRADAISSLRQATDKLRRLVARLSEPVKSLSGEYRRDARPTDLVAIIRRVLAANVEPHTTLYRTETRLPDKLIATVEPDRIENVVENLVINAVEAMGAAGGRLTVEAGELEGGFVYFSVADTGVGMAEEFLRTRLYHPFATTKTKGIGLGLYTCREVVEAHGGRLDVESRLGAGTHFRVVLPSRLFISGDRRWRPQKGTVAVKTSEPGS